MLLKKAVSIFGGLGIALAAATAVSAATFEIVPSVSDDHTTITAEIAISPSKGETAAAFNGYTLKLGYDPTVLEPIATDNKDPLNETLYATNNLTDLSGVFVADNMTSNDNANIAIGWASAENKSTSEKLGIAKVSFKVLNNSNTKITLDVTSLAKNASELDSLILAGTQDAEGDIKLVSDKLKGDINGDQAINYKDAVFVLRSSANLISLTNEQLLVADVNNDSSVNYKDAVFILRYAAGLLEKFPE